nr:hypothetical protein [uncultured Psychroserpens sp.]
MKTTKYTFVLLLLFGIFTFQSCENESLDSDFFSNVNDEDDIDDTNDGNDDTTGTGEESTGDYWPRAIGNMWDFNDTFYGEVNYNMIGTEEIDGNTYYKFDDLFNQEAWLRKSGDSYFIRNAVGGFPIEGYEVSTTFITVKMLEDTANVGDQWSSNVSYTISYVATNPAFPEIPDIDFSAVYNFQMIGRDLSRTVEGEDYENVLQVRLSLSASGASSTVDYFYAKDIGLIEFIGDQSSGTLFNYNIN